MTAAREPHDGWTRIGASTDWSMALLGLGLSAIFSVAFSAPASHLLLFALGASPGALVAGLVVFPFAFLLVGLPLIVFTNRPARVNLGQGLLRVGWRTIRFDQLRHAYRMPGGQRPGQALLQLEMPRGLDARLPLSSDALPDLTLSELQLLLAMIERAPIEAKQGVPLHPPLAGEFGLRDSSQQIADGVSSALMPFGKVAYSKATLLVELQSSIEWRRAVDEASGESGMPERGDVARAASALRAGLDLARKSSQPWQVVLPQGEAPVVNGDYGRGLLGTAGKIFRRHQQAVEEWLHSVKAPLVDDYRGARLLGWVVLVAGLVLPFLAILFWRSAALIALGFGGSLIITAAAIFLWPVLAWCGILLTQRARIRRYRDSRTASLVALASGQTVPEYVQRFFGAPFPERSYGMQVYLCRIVLAVVAFSVGFSLLMIGFASGGQTASPLVVLISIGVPLLGGLVPLIISAMRWQRRMTGELARARVEWELLSASAPAGAAVGAAGTAS